jgi:ABC-type branched-subunit amino acid transport system ATPase component
LGIGRLFQDVRVFDRLSVLDNVLLAENNPCENPFLSLLQRKKMRRLEKENIKEAGRWLEFVGLSDMRDTLAENLSYGQQKLLAIARLLMGRFDLFLLDEPTAGVNPKMVKPILGLIRRFSNEGKTVIVIEHNMTVVLEISDWVYFLDDGMVVSSGLPDDVLRDATVRKSYLGL